MDSDGRSSVLVAILMVVAPPAILAGIACCERVLRMTVPADIPASYTNALSLVGKLLGAALAAIFADVEPLVVEVSDELLMNVEVKLCGFGLDSSCPV